MYLPPQFQCADAELAADVMRSHPLASLISTDASGVPFVSHLPLHLERRGEARWLLGHCARANPHWRYLQERPTALVTFLGPHGYLSPSVYPDRTRVPSWNYVAVHCTVRANLVHEAAAKDDLLKKLIADHEPGYAAQWRSLDEEFARKMLAGIVGFELEITQLQCKVKLNQHRPESHRALRAGYAAGGEREQELARWMDRLGLGG